MVQRVAAFLSCPMMFAPKGCDGSRRILTECIIGVPLSVSLMHARLFKSCICILHGTIIRRNPPQTPHKQDFFVTLRQPRETLECGEHFYHTDIDRDKNSPFHGPIAVKGNVAVRGTKRICNLMSAVQSMFQICTILFDKPRRVFAKSLSVLGKLVIHTFLLIPVHMRCMNEIDHAFFVPMLP